MAGSQAKGDRDAPRLADPGRRAAAAAWRRQPAPAHLTVALSNFRFDPAPIRLKRGQPYVLHLVNRSGRKHNFVAPAFFAAARAGRAKVDVPPGGSANAAIVAPTAGRYKVKCTHLTHAMRGMKTEIIVE